MRVEEFVGQRVREHREQLEMTQEELGKRLEPLLGKAWPRQAVWAAERGQRAFTAAELVALAAVLETRPTRLLTPPIELDEIELPGGATLRARDTAELPLADPFLAEVWDLAQRYLRAAQQAQTANAAVLDAGSSLAARIEKHVQRALDNLIDGKDEIVFNDEAGAADENR